MPSARAAPIRSKQRWTVKVALQDAHTVDLDAFLTDYLTLVLNPHDLDEVKDDDHSSRTTCDP